MSRSMFPPRTVLVAIAAALTLLVVGALPAMACSCYLGDPRDALERADGAFVGRLRSIADAGGGQEIYTFRVGVAVKGSLGTTVDVRTSASGASCGLEVKVGKRVGLLLSEHDGGWTSSLCSQLSPRTLLRAAQPLPPPDGQGPVRYVIGGNLGPNRLMALDAHGRTLAYGEGKGYALDVEACPGGRRVVESAVLDRPSPPRRGVLVVRRTRSLAQVRSVTVVETKWPSVDDIACRNRRGSRLLAVEEHGGAWWVHDVRWRKDRIAWHGEVRSAFLDRGRPYVIRDGVVFAVRLDERRLRRVMPVPRGVDRVSFSPDGRWVAMFQRGSVFDPNRSSMVLVRDLRTGGVDEHAFGNAQSFGVPTWADDRTLVHVPRYGRAHVFRVPGLGETASFGPWEGDASAVERGRVFGIGSGRLVRARLDDGSMKVVRRFGFPEMWALEVLPR